MQNAPHQVVFVQVIMKYNLQIEKELSIRVPVRSFDAFNNFFHILSGSKRIVDGGL